MSASSGEAAARTLVQLFPPSVVRKRPRSPPFVQRSPEAAAKATSGFVG
ncbi:MAG: hypothetical protein IPP07_17480 [Holophagales bacterium]|nr:hypothetical protein [Holophagales bacterium]